MNRGLKTVAERAVVGSGIAAIARRMCRSRVLVLAYHNIVPSGESVDGDWNLHLPQREFARQLNLIQRTHEVVPLASIFEPGEHRTRPRVAITFDDAYIGALTAGIDELVERGMPSTVFVAPGLLGTIAWWDILARPRPNGLDEDVRRYALNSLAGKGQAVVAWAQTEGMTLGSSHGLPRIASVKELEQAAAKTGVSLGSHTWSHPNLLALAPETVDDELSKPFRWLRERFACSIPWLSYPYGLLSPALSEAAARAGYVGALRIEGGWIRQAAKMPHMLPRLNVPVGLSLNGLALRLSGIADRR